MPLTADNSHEDEAMKQHQRSSDTVPNTSTSGNSHKDNFAVMSADPIKARQLVDLQVRACDRISTIIDELAASFAGEYQSRAAAPRLLPQPSDLTDLASQARHRQGVARQWKELAETIVIDALRNLDNPDWNPLDPETDEKGGRNMLEALILWDPDKDAAANAAPT